MKTWVRMSAPIAALAMLGGCGVFKGANRKTPVVGERVPILASENEITADKTLEGVEVLLPAAEANASWSQPGGNAAKSMGHPALGATIARAWDVQIPGGDNRRRLAAAPVVDENRLFVIDVNGTVHAFAADTGARLWERSTVGEDEGNRAARFGGGVSVEAGRVYATNGLGDVVAIDATNGSEIWRKRPGGPLRGAPTVAYGQLYAISQDNQLFALDAVTGNLQWSASASLETQGVFGVAAPAAGQSTIVAGFSSGELNAYRYEAGRSLWSDILSRSTITTSVSSLSDIDAEPVIDQGRVYAVGQGGRMVAMDLTTGARIWEQYLAGISTPWIAGEWLFVVTDDARLMCIARSTGKIRWISQLTRWRNPRKMAGPVSWVGPVLAGDRLILASSRGEILSVSPKDGSIQSTIESKDRTTLSPVVANNTLYILSDRGRLTAYR